MEDISHLIQRQINEREYAKWLKSKEAKKQQRRFAEQNEMLVKVFCDSDILTKNLPVQNHYMKQLFFSPNR